MNREAIYSKLFSVISGTSGVVTVGRKLKHWSEVSQAEQPAVFQAQKSEDIINQTGMPAKVKMLVNIYVYTHSQDPYASPATAMNTLLDAITAALMPDGVSQTLGGLVAHCRIAGVIQTDEGVLGDQAVSVIPVEILANV